MAACSLIWIHMIFPLPPITRKSVNVYKLTHNLEHHYWFWYLKSLLVERTLREIPAWHQVGSGISLSIFSGVFFNLLSRSKRFLKQDALKNKRQVLTSMKPMHRRSATGIRNLWWWKSQAGLIWDGCILNKSECIKIEASCINVKVS